MKQNNIKNIYRGDIIWVDLGEFPGSHRQSGKGGGFIENGTKKLPVVI